MSTTLLTTYRARATRFASSLLRGVSGGILKAERGVASCGGGSYLSPREARDPARQALRPGCEELAVTDPLPAEAQAEGGSGERSAAPGAQNRHGGAPRGERPASWDARRLARRLTRRVMACPTGASQAPERLSALRPPLDGVSEAKRQSPDAAMRARERDGLFDIVRFANAARSRLSGRSRESGNPGSLAGGHGSRLSARCAGVGRDDVVARRSNLWLWETMSGWVSLFPACSLQGTAQPQRVAPSVVQPDSAARPALVAQPHRDVESPAAVREGRAVAARRCG
jgi:hypothetical protein